MAYHFGLDVPDQTFVAHNYREETVDLGEVVMNYAEAGSRSAPPLLLIPSQTESWWGYEEVMRRLEPSFNLFAVDLRGQGRTTRTPGRYTLDNMGGDLVRFIDRVIGRPTFVSGLSSGGLLSAWLSAYAMPGQVLAACYEDPPLFASELTPAYGPGMRQGLGPLFALFAKHLGDQWSLGDWDGLLAATRTELPSGLQDMIRLPASPPQNMREYDPEWARAFHSGAATASCDHGAMLCQVKIPVLFTHHARALEADSGLLVGAISDLQAARVGALVRESGGAFDYRSFPDAAHSLHETEPELFADTLRDWLEVRLHTLAP